MTRNDNGSIVLTTKETTAVAMLIALRKLEAADEWLEWEDAPMLTFDGHVHLLRAVRQTAGVVSGRLMAFEEEHDIDARHIYGEIT